MREIRPLKSKFKLKKTRSSDVTNWMKRVGLTGEVAFWLRHTRKYKLFFNCSKHHMLSASIQFLVQDSYLFAIVCCCVNASLTISIPGTHVKEKPTL
jgi:hypothetical protein